VDRDTIISRAVRAGWPAGVLVAVALVVAILEATR
jgi:hypothetical protein